MSLYMEGKFPKEETLPVEIREFMIAKEMGWTLDYVRSISIKDAEALEIMIPLYTLNDPHRSMPGLPMF
jgi:hypothetical protein